MSDDDEQREHAPDSEQVREYELFQAMRDQACIVCFRMLSCGAADESTTSAFERWKTAFVKWCEAHDAVRRTRPDAGGEGS